MLLALLLAFADTATPRLMAAPKLGLFEPTSRLSGALLLGAEFGYLTPALDDRLAVVLEVDWVRPRASGTITDPRAPAGQTYSLGNGEVGILLSAVYRAENFVPRFTPYAGGGPGILAMDTACHFRLSPVSSAHLLSSASQARTWK